MEVVKKGWLYGLMVFLSQTCNPHYQPPPPSPDVGAIMDEAFSNDEEIAMEKPPPPPPPAPAPEREETFKIVEDMPNFPGCEDVADRQARKICAEKKMMSYIYQNLEYPEIAKNNKIEGRVILSFVIRRNGSISDVKVLRDIGGGCGEEAARIVKSMPKWNPGKQRGRPVSVQYTLPVLFKL